MNRISLIEGIAGRVLAPDLDLELHPDGFGLRVEWPEGDERILEKDVFCERVLDMVHRFGMVHVQLPQTTFKALRGRPYIWKWSNTPKQSVRSSVPHSDYATEDYTAHLTTFFNANDLKDRSTGFSSLKYGKASLLHAWKLQPKDNFYLHRAMKQLEALDPSDQKALAAWFANLDKALIEPGGDMQSLWNFVDAARDYLREGMEQGAGVGPRAIEHAWGPRDVVISSGFSVHWRGHSNRPSAYLRFDDYTA